MGMGAETSTITLMEAFICMGILMEVMPDIRMAC